MAAQTAMTEIEGFGEISNLSPKNGSSLLAYTIRDILFWWYIQMPYWHYKRLLHILRVIDDILSITFLIKTFFVPWHRDRNGIGYFMGVCVRIIYLPIAMLVWISILGLYMLAIVFWLLTPILGIIFIILTPFIRSS